MVQGHYTSFTQRHSVEEVWSRLGKGERRYAPDKWSRSDRLITIGCPHSGALIKGQYYGNELTLQLKNTGWDFSTCIFMVFEILMF